MKGDFSRDTFDPLRNYSRVLQLQGRVHLEADWNEQTAILLHYMRMLGADLMGPHAGTSAAEFEIKATDENNHPFISDFQIGSGRYYVDGIPCVNAEPLMFTTIANPGEKVASGKSYLAYLDAWERLIGYVEAPTLADDALGRIETSARAQIVWRVRLVNPAAMTVPLTVAVANIGKDNAGHQAFLEFLGKNNLLSPGTGKLAASAAGFDAGAAGIGGYRGPDNQLYRVEIHTPGRAWSPLPGSVPKNEAATFKWSRENGSVLFAIDPVGIGATRVRVHSFGLDKRLDLQPGDWVELMDDDYMLQGKAKVLLRVHTVDRAQMTVTLEGESDSALHTDKHPLLRRWDHRAIGAAAEQDLRDGALIVQAEPKSLELEHGLEIRFKGGDAYYQTGDYWLIAARTTGEIELAPSISTLQYVPPRGEEHHYAPLAVITADGAGAVTSKSLRRVLNQLWTAP